jgi:hypothetical protein
VLAHNNATRDYIEKAARAALPDAPKVPASDTKATPRRALAALLLALADRVSPEPVERSRWQNV